MSKDTAAAVATAPAGPVYTFNVNGKKKPDAATIDIALKDVKVVKDFNARKDFGDLDQLAASIKKVGLLQPIVVRPIAGEPGKYQLLAGERRYKAVKSLDREVIPCVIREMDDETAEYVNLIENGDGDDGVRKSLEPVELGNAFVKISEKYNLDPAGIAKKTGFNHMMVRRYVGIVKNLSPAVLKRVGTDGDLSIAAATALSEVKPEARDALLKVGITPGMTADQIKLAAKQALEGKAPADDESAAPAAKGASTSSGSGGGRSLNPVVWRKATEMNNTLRQACHMLVEGASDATLVDSDIHRILGIVGTLLYLRNDADSPEIPQFVDASTRKFTDIPDELPEGMNKKKAKIMATAIRAEAAKHAEILAEAAAEEAESEAKEEKAAAPKGDKKGKKGKKSAAAAEEPEAEEPEIEDDEVEVDDGAEVEEDDGDDE